MVYSYLPVEAFEAENAAGQVNAPAIHYHLAGKGWFVFFVRRCVVASVVSSSRLTPCGIFEPANSDAIHMMTTKVSFLQSPSVQHDHGCSLRLTSRHPFERFLLDDQTASGYSYHSSMRCQNDAFDGFQGNFYHPQR